MQFNNDRKTFHTPHAKYGVRPDILYAEVPVSVDNIAKVIEPA